MDEQLMLLGATGNEVSVKCEILSEHRSTRHSAMSPIGGGNHKEPHPADSHGDTRAWDVWKRTLNQADGSRDAITTINDDGGEIYLDTDGEDIRPFHFD